MKKAKILSIVLSCVLAFTSLTACSNPTMNSSQTTEISVAESIEFSDPIIITDQIGRKVTFDAPVKKLVSSYYISTAILVALGLEDQLVGIEAKADTRLLYAMAAPNLLDVPAIGTGKGVNIEEIAALSPDVVILPQKLSDSVEALESLGIPVVVVNPETLDEFLQCIELLGIITDTADTAQALLTYYNEKINEIETLTASLSYRPSVYLSSGSSYLATCTSKMYQNDLIALAGGENVSKELEEGYWQTISAEQLNLWQPEYFFAVSYAQYSLEDIQKDIALSEITAIKEGNVYSFPSNIEPWDYPTPSSVLGILYLTQMLHPDIYTQEQYIEEATAFYYEFFDINITSEDLGLN